MSVGEIIALVVFAGVSGAAVGAGFAAVALRGLPPRRGSAGAYARWLAARLAASRACLALATALRAVRCEDHSTHMPLRYAEVSRARTQWYRAQQTLDLAVVRLVAHTRNAGLRAEVTRIGDNDRAAFQRAVDGSADELDALVRRLRQADEQAVELFDAAVLRRGRSSEKVYATVTHFASLGRRIVESWRRP